MSNMGYLSTPGQATPSEMYNIATFQTHLRTYAYPAIFSNFESVIVNSLLVSERKDST